MDLRRDAPTVAAFDDVFREFDRLERLMSVWKDGSDVVRLNAAAGDHPVPVSADTRAVLLVARQVSEWTDGKFDVTFGALVRHLEVRSGPGQHASPIAAAIRARLPLIDYRVRRSGRRAPARRSLQRKGMRVHLGGIGKGYAVDRAVDILRRRRASAIS